jgi:acyl carrier protein
MTRSEIQDRVIDILVTTFDLERATVAPEARLAEDLDLDSIDALDMVVELQSLVSGRLDERELKGLRTVGDVVDIVERQLARNAIASAS